MKTLWTIAGLVVLGVAGFAIYVYLKPQPRMPTGGCEMFSLSKAGTPGYDAFGTNLNFNACMDRLQASG